MHDHQFTSSRGGHRSSEMRLHQEHCVHPRWPQIHLPHSEPHSDHQHHRADYSQFLHARRDPTKVAIYRHTIVFINTPPSAPFDAGAGAGAHTTQQQPARRRTTLPPDIHPADQQLVPHPPQGQRSAPCRPQPPTVDRRSLGTGPGRRGTCSGPFARRHEVQTPSTPGAPRRPAPRGRMSNIS